jgi:hypothetical protein
VLLCKHKTRQQLCIRKRQEDFNQQQYTAPSCRCRQAAAHTRTAPQQGHARHRSSQAGAHACCRSLCAHSAVGVPCLTATVWLSCLGCMQG